MASRLDELFSTDRLRQNWQMPAAPVAKPEQFSANFEIHAHYQELHRLMGEKFSDLSRLSSLFETLTREIDRLYPLDASSSPAGPKDGDGIVALLEQLEELIWAMDLSQRKGGR